MIYALNLKIGTTCNKQQKVSRTGVKLHNNRNSYAQLYTQLYEKESSKDLGTCNFNSLDAR